MIKKKILQIVFHDGTADGIRICMSPLSPIKAFVIPRSDLVEAKGLVGIDGPGIFFLVNLVGGVMTNFSARQSAGNLAGLDERNTKKEFWNYALLFTAKGDYFTESVIGTLLEQVVRRARVRVHAIDEGFQPSMGAGSRRAEEIFEEIMFILSALGFHLPEATPSAHTTASGKGGLRKKIPFASPGLLMARRKKVVAFGLIYEDFFELQTDSEIDFETPAHVDRYNKQREELLKDGTIVKRQDGRYFLTKPVSFERPSGASNFALGGSTNGWIEWRDQKGRTLDELVRKKTLGNFRKPLARGDEETSLDNGKSS